MNSLPEDTPSPWRVTRPSLLGRARAALGSLRRCDACFVIAPLVILAGLTLGCLLSGADSEVSGCFFCESKGRWPLARAEPWRTLYLHGCTPAVCLGVTGLCMGVCGLFVPSLRPCRRPGLFLAATLILGPGILVNGVLKPRVARPRPVETTTFGGEKAPTFFGSTGESSPSKSFPSGHASMGFFLMTPALLFYRRRPRVALTILVAGGGYGALMGAARVVQGAHFTTDVLASALLVYVTGVVVLGLADLTRAALEPAAADDGPALLTLPTADAADEPARRAA